MVSFSAFSHFPPHLREWLKTLLHETSEAFNNDVWVIDWAMTDHDDTHLATLARRWVTAPVHRLRVRSTEREHQGNLGRHRVCSMAAQQQLVVPRMQNQVVSSRG